jgi:hypothetical protein
LHKKAAAPLIDEYSQLIWDDRSQRREEHPGCANHCCFVDGTLVMTARGNVPIETVTNRDLVLTRQGWRPVEWCAPTGQKPVIRVDFSDGTVITGTPEHPIWTQNRGWTRLDALTPTDVFVTSHSCVNSTPVARQRLLSGTDRLGGDGLSLSAEATACTSSGTQSGFIAQCGSIIMALFQRATRFITETATRSTTTFQTWSALSPLTINGITGLPLAMMSKPSGLLAWSERDWPRRFGTHRPKAESGTANTLARSQPIDLTSWFSARFVELSSPPNVKDAEFAVERVTPAGTARVWALKVSGTPEYFANGVLVHNCDAALYAWRHCYAYLSDMRQDNGLRYGKSEDEWMLMQEEQELERLLQEKRNMEAEIELYGDPLDQLN